ncbi:MAG: hypothetical protein NZ561_05360, partial [Phycisphaerae bacterium]|nr:hypothetical protein [Phycisphaerae bacterium]MDW8261119.1 hypothetical protein [Phycisphaerales bacterium]
RTAHTLHVTPEAASLLADLVGPDLGRIDNELAKLALMGNGEQVDVATVSVGVAFQREQGMWKLTDALSTGDIAAAVRCWRRLLQIDSSSEYRAVTWLTLWLQKLAKVQEMSAKRVPAATISAQLRIWPVSQVDDMRRVIQRLGPTGIATALQRLAQVDLRSKTGVGEAARNVEMFLLSLARAGQAGCAG